MTTPLVSLATLAPALKPLPDSSSRAAVLHTETSDVGTAARPGMPVEILEIYSSDLLDGSVIPERVAIGVRLVEVLWFGNFPRYMRLDQINVRVPAGIARCPTVRVWLKYPDGPSNVVTIGVGEP
jgi:uncharacterized protein (TIGR03437 family)